MDNPTTNAVTSKTQHIWCSASIDKRLEDILTGMIMSRPDVTEYVLYLSTSGGNPFSAVNLYELFKSQSATTTAYNMGSISSAGVTFFLGFQKRVGVPFSTFSIHDTTMRKDFLSNIFPQDVGVADLDLQKSALERTNIQTQRIIVEETSARSKEPFDMASIKQAFRESKNYDSTEAIKFGFIDKTEKPTIPKTDVIYLTEKSIAELSAARPQT